MVYFKECFVILFWKSRSNSFEHWFTIKAEKSSGEIHLLNCKVEDASARIGRKFCFEVISKDRVLPLVADNQQDMDSWMSAINKASKFGLFAPPKPMASNPLAPSQPKQQQTKLRISCLMCEKCETKAKGLISTFPVS